MRVLAVLLGISGTAAGLWLVACGIECAIAYPLESGIAALAVVGIMLWVWRSWPLCLEGLIIREDW